MRSASTSRLMRLMLLAAFSIWALIPADASAYKRYMRIVAFGDSIMAGYGLDDPKDSLPNQINKLTNDSRARFMMIPMAVSGDTTSSALARMPDVLSQKPDIVILAFGGNDALRGIDPDVTYNNLEVMLKQFERAGVYVLFCGMKAPPSMGYEYMTRFNRIFPQLADRHGVTFYPFLLDGVIGNRLYSQRDGIHPSKEGVAYIAGQMSPPLHLMLSKLRMRSGESAPAPKKVHQSLKQKEADEADEQQKRNEQGIVAGAVGAPPVEVPTPGRPVGE